MFLACDIGNTNIKTGLFKDNHLIEYNFFEDVSPLLDYIKKKKLNEIAVSSVVPSLTLEFKALLNEPELKFTAISNQSKFNLKIDYKTPESLGVDRICSSEGAYSLCCKGKQLSKNEFLVTIDFGTATTINLISSPSNFQGGVIAPGINMMLRSLAEGTALLPFISLADYKNVVGNTTKRCISSGIVNSQLGLITNFIESLKKEHKAEVIHTYTTGGNYEMIKPFLPFDHNNEKALVLYGIRSICNN